MPEQLINQICAALPVFFHCKDVHASSGDGLTPPCCACTQIVTPDRKAASSCKVHTILGIARHDVRGQDFSLQHRRVGEW